jgi:hypothetical protein
MRRRTVASGIAAALALGVAALAVATAPGGDSIADPFPVRGALGEAVEGREFTIDVHSVRLAEAIGFSYRADAESIRSDGAWVVVELTVTPTLGTPTFSYVQLDIGGRLYRTNDVLPAPSLSRLPFGAGIPSHGTIVFEVPRSAIESSAASGAVIRFQHRIDPQLDSVPMVEVDLSTVDVEREILIEETYVEDAE